MHKSFTIVGNHYLCGLKCNNLLFGIQDGFYFECYNDVHELKILDHQFRETTGHSRSDASHRVINGRYYKRRQDDRSFLCGFLKQIIKHSYCDLYYSDILDICIHVHIYL